MSWRWAVAVLAVVAQTLALYWPDPVEAPDGLALPHADKVVHVGIFLLATWALLRVLPAWGALGLMAVQVVASELVQGALLPHRSADVWDAVADLVGIALGWALWRWTQRRAIDEAVAVARGVMEKRL
ncbi:hypothetical protein [Propioniciclava soli]|uniref:hypothetical protein n=1 Tax=Propioniciclava soli TaxID=2775081 RepID=UPI001E2C82C4|nr:hypothetical protein [Propioniciclava soli]